MIEELKDIPARVSGNRVSGRITADDFVNQTGPGPDVDSDDIRFVEVTDPDFEGFGPGGLLADIKQGFSTMTHLRAFRRTAVVTDKEWMAHPARAGPDDPRRGGPCSASTSLEAAKQWAAGWSLPPEPSRGARRPYHGRLAPVGRSGATSPPSLPARSDNDQMHIGRLHLCEGRPVPDGRTRSCSTSPTAPIRCWCSTPTRRSPERDRAVRAAAMCPALAITVS